MQISYFIHLMRLTGYAISDRGLAGNYTSALIVWNWKSIARWGWAGRVPHASASFAEGWETTMIDLSQIQEGRGLRRAPLLICLPLKRAAFLRPYASRRGLVRRSGGRPARAGLPWDRGRWRDRSRRQSG